MKIKICLLTIFCISNQIYGMQSEKFILRAYKASTLFNYNALSQADKNEARGSTEAFFKNWQKGASYGCLGSGSACIIAYKLFETHPKLSLFMGAMGFCSLGVCSLMYLICKTHLKEFARSKPEQSCINNSIKVAIGLRSLMISGGLQPYTGKTLYMQTNSKNFLFSDQINEVKYLSDFLNGKNSKGSFVEE